MKIIQRISSLVAGAVGLGIVVYLWNTLGERGFDADMNGTAGYTTPFEVLLGAVALVLIAASIILVLRRPR